MTAIDKTRRPTALVVAVALLAGVVTLGGAVGLGLRLPGDWLGSAPDDTTELDYAALGRRLSRLRDGYVRDVLGDASTARAGAVAGTAREVAVAAKPSAVVHAFTNDDFEHAYAAQTLPFAARTDASGASRQASEPGDCLPAGGTSWYRYDAERPTALFADTFGTRGATALAVYSGSSLDSLEQVGCDVNVLGNAQVGFTATGGTTYWFQISRALTDGPSLFGLAPVGATTVESISPLGEPADDGTVHHPDISADGRYVAFTTYAANLADARPDCGLNDSEPAFYCASLYLRDRRSGWTSRLVAHSQPGLARDIGSTSLQAPSVSDDGRYIGFTAYCIPPDEITGARCLSEDAQPLNNSAYLLDRTTGRIELVSRNSAGEAAHSNPSADNGAATGGGSFLPSVSADGRYIVFNSDANNLGGPVEPGRYENVYIRDRATGTTRVVSTDSEGEPIHGNSCAGSGRNVSADGRFVAYMSSTEPKTAYTLLRLVYLWDSTTGRSRLISKLPPGEAPSGTYCPVISRDGSRVGMVSRDPLVPEDTNGTPDVYVYDVAGDTIRRVSVDSAGRQTIDPNYAGEDSTPVIGRAVTLSGDGRYAVFDSAAPDLAPGPVGSTRPNADGSPGPRHIYVHDLVTGSTRLVSVSSTGESLPGDNTVPYLAADGSAVVFLNKVGSGLTNVYVHELR